MNDTNPNPNAQAERLAEAIGLVKTIVSHFTADVEMGEKLLESNRAWLASAKAFLAAPAPSSTGAR